MIRPRGLAAGFHAGAASGGAFLHLAQFVTGLAAGFANLGAEGEDGCVKLALAQDGIAGEGADVHAIQHQPYVLGPGMLAAQGQAMIDRHRQARAMAMGQSVQGVAQLRAIRCHGRKSPERDAMWFSGG